MKPEDVTKAFEDYKAKLLADLDKLMDIYLEGYTDGYNKALGKPAVQEGGTADRKEFVKREGKRDE